MTLNLAEADLPVIRVSARRDGVPGLNFSGGEEDLTDFIHQLNLTEGEPLLCNLGYIAVKADTHQKLESLIERMKAIAPNITLEDVMSGPVDFELLAQEVTQTQTPENRLHIRSIESGPRVANYHADFVLEHTPHI